jgi:hypothetical protein
MHRSGNLWWGMILIVLGVMFLLHNTHYIDFGDVIHNYWPALLIVWGASILLGKSRASTAPSGGGQVPPPSVPPSESHAETVFGDRNEKPDTDIIGFSGVFGDVALHPVSANFRGGDVSTVFGDTAMDLSAATLADGENRLKLNGVFGDVGIMLAPTMPYALTAHSLFGSVQAAGQKRDGFSTTLTMQSPDFAAAPKKLLIDVSQVFGDITLTR